MYRKKRGTKRERERKREREEENEFTVKENRSCTVRARGMSRNGSLRAARFKEEVKKGRGKKTKRGTFQREREREREKTIFPEKEKDYDDVTTLMKFRRRTL